MRELFKNNKKLIIVTGSILLIILIYYSLLIAHYIEKRIISNKPGTTLNMIPDDVGYKAYDVDGMTEEEIKEYLDIIRSGENEVDE